MSTSVVIIIAQIFLVLVAIGGVLLFYFNKLNNDLQAAIDKKSAQLADQKRHTKGLRIKLQTEIKEAEKLKAQLKKLEANSGPSQESYEELEKEYQETQSQLEGLEKQNGRLAKSNAKLKEKQKQLEEALESAKQAVKKKPGKATAETEPTGDDNYEEMYHDLKNSIAFSLSGGDQTIDMLQARLEKNGNISESEKLAELKEKYSSVSEMVGITMQPEISATVPKVEQEKDARTIEVAEGTLESAKQTLHQVDNQSKELSAQLESDNTAYEETQKALKEALDLNQRLKGDLNLTSQQLSAFIAKAKVFHKQKEQLRVYKAAQQQMHKNYINLNAEHKQLNRHLQTAEARNQILTSKIENQSTDPEAMVKLAELKVQLEEKEKTMDRLLIEKDMLEQQFLDVSKESEDRAESSSQLERLTSEHQLLEQQFLELLSDMEAKS